MKNLFKPGNTIGAAGRPRGSRNKMAQAFFDALHKIMTEPVAAQPGKDMTKGEEVLRNLYRREPLQFVKAIINALPSNVEFTSVASSLSDEDLALYLEKLRQLTAPRAPKAPKAPILLEAKRDGKDALN
jgi:hypothetical protein